MGSDGPAQGPKFGLGHVTTFVSERLTFSWCEIFFERGRSRSGENFVARELVCRTSNPGIKGWPLLPLWRMLRLCRTSNPGIKGWPLLPLWHRFLASFARIVMS